MCVFNKNSVLLKTNFCALKCCTMAIESFSKGHVYLIYEDVQYLIFLRVKIVIFFFFNLTGSGALGLVPI